MHAGAVPDPTTGARAVPIHQTTSYVYRDTAHAAAAFELADLTTHAYTRLSNPTTAVASGQAATSLALLNLARSGDHIVASSSLYGGTRTLRRRAHPRVAGRAAGRPRPRTGLRMHTDADDALHPHSGQRGRGIPVGAMVCALAVFFAVHQ